MSKHPPNGKYRMTTKVSTVFVIFYRRSQFNSLLQQLIDFVDLIWLRSKPIRKILDAGRRILPHNMPKVGTQSLLIEFYAIKIPLEGIMVTRLTPAPLAFTHH